MTWCLKSVCTRKRRLRQWNNAGFFLQPQLMNRKVKLKKLFTQVTTRVGHIQQLLAENMRLLFDLASITSVVFHCPFQNNFVSVRLHSYK